MHDNKSFFVPKAGFKLKKEVGQYPWYAENLERGLFHNPQAPFA